MRFSDGLENQSGIQEEAYFIPLSWMKFIAKPKIGNTAASLSEILDSHVMEPGKKLVLMTPLSKKSGFKSTLEGEELSKMFKQGPAEFFIPQITATNIGTISALKNYRGIVLMMRPGDDMEFIQIGSQGMPAYMIGAETEGGTGPTGAVGTKVTFEAYGRVPCYIYNGGVPTDKVPAPAPASGTK